MMPGVDAQEFHRGLVESFREDELERLVRFQLNQRLDRIVAPGPFDDVVFDLLSWVENRGLEPELARAAYRERPKNELLRRVYEKYGLAPEVSVQLGGKAVAASPTRATNLAFEATVKPRLQFVDLGVWREKLAAIEGQVCRVEFNNNPRGTGFLIGPDLLLTNYHVLEKPLKGELPHQQVIIRFDYKVLSDGSKSEGTVVGLDTNWKVDHTSYSKAEAESQPDRELPAADELDFAVVRLARPIGDEPVGRAAAAGALKRGWVSFPCVPPAFAASMPLLIAQHPDGKAMQLALDTDSVIGVNGNGTRVRYATNTDHGSSGSPCFDIDFRLAALHHMGDPDWKSPEFNQGVPIGLIAQRLIAKGVALPPCI